MAKEDIAAKMAKLRQVVALINSASETVIGEWEKEASGAYERDQVDGVTLPSPACYDASRVLKAAASAMEELVTDPNYKLITFATSYWASRALHIAAEHRIADVLDAAGPDGVSIADLAKELSVEKGKLGRIMRCLASEYIFKEVTVDKFANSVFSQALVKNEPLRAYIVMFSMEPYAASEALPEALNDPEFATSYDVDKTAFQLATGSTLPMWAWLEEKIPIEDAKKAMMHRHHDHDNYPPSPPPEPQQKEEGGGVAGAALPAPTTNGVEMVHRPLFDIFGLAMVGGGRAAGAAHFFDFPWAELGPGATIVDVGGGVGGFDLQLAKLYPNLRFVIQDRPQVVEYGEALWRTDYPSALQAGRVKFMHHDFFAAAGNPVRGADVYWMRYIMHDWADDAAVALLKGVAAAMSPTSKLLLTESVMNTTLGCSGQFLKSAPPPLLANFGPAMRFSHQRDLAMMALINGVERTPEEFRGILGRAGLRMEKVWECRSEISIVECRLA